MHSTITVPENYRPLLQEACFHAVETLYSSWAEQRTGHVEASAVLEEAFKLEESLQEGEIEIQDFFLLGNWLIAHGKCEVEHKSVVVGKVEDREHYEAVLSWVFDGWALLDAVKASEERILE